MYFRSLSLMSPHTHTHTHTQATARVLGIQNQRITQCRYAKLTLLGPEKLPVQVDGEAWLQEPGTVIVSHKNKARMLFKDKVGGRK